MKNIQRSVSDILWNNNSKLNYIVSDRYGMNIKSDIYVELTIKITNSTNQITDNGGKILNNKIND